MVNRGVIFHSLSAFISLSLSLTGMSAEVLSMLLAAVMQGQVLRVYNTERENSCMDTDDNDELTYSTPPPSIASLQNTV